ncbi:hypothetical protein Tco_0512249, partial [Tanacetum coccineum]
MPKPDDKELRQSAMGSEILGRPKRDCRGVCTRSTDSDTSAVEALVDDRQYHYETARLLDQEALVSREAWEHSMGFSSAVHYKLQGYRTHGHLATALGEIRALQAREHARADVPEGTGSSSNNIPPKRTSATKTARTAAATAAVVAAAAAATAPITAAAVEQLVADRVFTALANHDTLRNNTNGHGDGSHNSGTGTRGATLTQRECTYKDFLNCHPLNFKGTEGVVVLSKWFEKMESVFHISNCAPKNQALKKLMTVKYCPRGEIKKLEIELWNLKVKGTDIPSYTLRFQELALMCGRMFPEESDEVEKYVSGLPDMIRGNVMSYRPQTMEEVIEFANDQMNQKLITISERQAEQKRKIEFNAGNNQGYQQQNKRQNTGRAYTAGTGEKREYTGSTRNCE